MCPHRASRLKELIFLLPRFLVISVSVFLDCRVRKHASRFLLPSHPHCLIEPTLCLPSFQDADPNPLDSTMPEEIQNYLHKTISPAYRQQESDAIDAAIAGNNSALIYLRQFAPAFDCPSNVIVYDRFFAGPAGRFKVRSYLPAAHIQTTIPVLIYIHGGGWVNGNLGRRDSYCAMLAGELSIEVLSVNYTLSPEVPCGVSLKECQLVWESVSERFVMVSGDSSGGNLAAGLVMMIIESNSNRKPPDGVILIHPVIDLTNQSYYSKTRFAVGYGLDLGRMQKYIRAYVPDEQMRALPMYSPLYGNLTRYPPTLVVTAQFDLLRDEGRAFAQRLLESGRLVRYRCMEGGIHSSHHRAETPVLREKANREVIRFVRSILRETFRPYDRDVRL
jgi:acetyl esterase